MATSCGTLEVSVLRAAGLRPKLKLRNTNHPFCVVTLRGGDDDGAASSRSRRSSSGGGGGDASPTSFSTPTKYSTCNPSWSEGADISFEVADLGAELEVAVLCDTDKIPTPIMDRLTHRREPIGRAVLQLASLLPESTLQAMARQEVPPALSCRLWLELLPLPEGSAHFQPVVKGLYTSGMKRPKQTRPAIHLSHSAMIFLDRFYLLLMKQMHILFKMESCNSL